MSVATHADKVWKSPAVADESSPFAGEEIDELRIWWRDQDLGPAVCRCNVWGCGVHHIGTPRDARAEFHCGGVSGPSPMCCICGLHIESSDSSASSSSDSQCSWRRERQTVRAAPSHRDKQQAVLANCLARARRSLGAAIEARQSLFMRRVFRAWGSLAGRGRDKWFNHENTLPRADPARILGGAPERERHPGQQPLQQESVIQPIPEHQQQEHREERRLQQRRASLSGFTPHRIAVINRMVAQAQDVSDHSGGRTRSARIFDTSSSRVAWCPLGGS